MRERERERETGSWRERNHRPAQAKDRRRLHRTSLPALPWRQQLKRLKHTSSVASRPLSPLALAPTLEPCPPPSPRHVPLYFGSKVFWGLFA